MNKSAGFTLIELMIVVAIIGILAAIAMPSYRDYNSRAQVSEAITLAFSAKTTLADYFASTGDFSTLPSAGSLGITTSGKYVTTIDVTSASGGTVFGHATMKSSGLSPEIRGKIFGIETTDGGNNWLCGAQATDTSNNIDSRYLPSSCK